MAARTREGRRPVSYGWRMVAVFAITQTLGHGCLYYACAVLLPPIAADLHTSTTAVTCALTTAVLTWRRWRFRSADGSTRTAAGRS